MLSRLLLALTVLLCALELAAPAFAGYRPTTPSARSRFAQLHPGRLRASTPSHGGGARFFRMGPGGKTQLPRGLLGHRPPALQVAKVASADLPPQEHSAVATLSASSLQQARPGYGKCPVLWSGNADCTQAENVYKTLALATTSSDLNIMNGGIFLKAAKAADLNRTVVDPRQFTLSKQNVWAVDVLRRSQVLRGVAAAQLPEHDPFRTLDLTSCAVVGSAAGLKGGRAGNDIDAHTAVFRFNEAPTKSYEKDVGSKTTLRFQNPERAGRCEKPRELCVVRGYSLLNRPEKTVCRVVALAPQFNEYSKQYWRLYPHPTQQPAKVKGVPRVKMSTGFMGIALALQTCKKVSVYGIGKDSSRSGHYYPKKRTGGLADVRQRHPWSMEHDCLRMLSSLPTVHWLS